MSNLVQTAVDVPVLETERLVLRGHRPDDLADSAAMWADPLVTRHIGATALSYEAVWAKLLRQVGHWSWLGYGYWAIEEKATGELIGEVGFLDGKRDLQPSLDGMPEIGWALIASAHGKGFATEAVRAAVAWGDAHLGADKTSCIIHPENLASIRVAEKCGYREHARTTYKGGPTIVFTR